MYDTILVQVVPHITDAIQEWIERVAAIPVDGKDGPADVCIIELGGTIGDIESMPFIEALGQFSYRVGKVICLNKNHLMRMSRRNFPDFAMLWYDQCISCREYCLSL
nr:CTP synthase-like [Ipomoea batatas]